MTYEEALKYILTIPWKVDFCHVGESCWCRRIVPVEKIIIKIPMPGGRDGTWYQEDELDDIIGDSSIDAKTAEYIVNLHNEKLNNE